MVRTDIVILTQKWERKGKTSLKNEDISGEKADINTWKLLVGGN